MKVLSKSKLQIFSGGNVCSVFFATQGGIWGVASAGAATGFGVPLAIVAGIVGILGAAVCDDPQPGTPSGGYPYTGHPNTGPR